MTKPESNDLLSCPHCGMTTGFYTVSIQRSRQYVDFEGNGWENSMEYVSGGKTKYCAECDKIVSR